MLYGQWLNRSTRVKPVLLIHKPLSNLVEATITRETGEGSGVPTKNAFPQGFKRASLWAAFLSSHPQKVDGSAERIFSWQ
jgi:hypothetical protein